MGRARVSISAVEKFRQSVEEEWTSISHLKRSTDCIDILIQQAQKELRKIEKCQTRCSKALGIGEKKLSELGRELSQLMQELAVTPSTITVTVACGTDEEGNTIEERSEERNPKYDALLDQIDTVETKIQALESLLSELGEKIRELDRTSSTFENAIREFTAGKDELQEVCRSQERRSEHAVEQLRRAITCIRQYLDEKVSLNPVPHHTSINWTPAYSYQTLLQSQEKLIMPVRSWDDKMGEHESFYGVGGSHFAESQIQLLAQQGTANPDYTGTCGLTTIANCLRQLGIDETITEKDVLERALKLNACRKPGNNSSGGGTNINDLVYILDTYGAKTGEIEEISIDTIDACISKGGTVIIGIHDAHLKKTPGFWSGQKNMNHWVTVTGVRKNNVTGEIIGVFVQDTGGHTDSPNIYLPANDLKRIGKHSRDLTGVAVFK